MILLARLLALAFLVLAFSRPFIPGRQLATAAKPHVVGVFVDNSYSMQTLNNTGTLLDEARLRAKEIAAAYSLNTQFQLLTQNFDGKQQRLLNRDEFTNEVDKIKISAQSRSLQQIINRQQSLLNTQPGAVKVIYIISDFQKNMVSQINIKSAAGFDVNLVKLQSAKTANLAVDSLWLLNAVHRPGQTEKLVIKLHNYGDEQANKVPLKLIVNNAQKALGSFSVAPRQVQNDTLVFSGLNNGWQTALLELQDNPITFDNRFYFTFNVRQQMPVLLINGGVANKYINAVFSADSFFKPQVVSDGQVDYGHLSNYPLVVLTDIKAVSAGLSQQLKTYVSRGGVLIFFPADDADFASYKNLLQPLGTDYPQKLVVQKNKVALINLESEVFKTIFEQMPNHPDLPVANKYYQYSTVSGLGREILLGFEDKQLFFSAYKTGKGKVYVSAVALTDDYSNLQHHALLLPLMYRIALLSGHDQPLFYTIGDNETLSILPVHTTDKQLLKLSGDNDVIIPDVRQEDGETRLFFSDQVTQPGVYRLKMQDSLISLMAFNNNRSESDLSYLDDATIKVKFGNKAQLMESKGRPLNDTIAKTNIGIELWKLCIILTLICLAAEILLIRFYRYDKQPVSVPA